MSFTQWSRVLSVAAIAAWVGAGCSSKPQMTFQERLEMERQRQEHERSQPTS